MDKRIKNAIARIDAEHHGQSSRGTGFLVAKNLVLTALHVVGNRRADPPEPFAGPIRLTFRDHEPVLGEVVRETMRAHADWVFVRCEPPPGVEPIPIWTEPPAGARWENWGFPDSNPEGLAQSGHIEDEDARLATVHAYQLFSKQAAAGLGAKPRGWSGSPVIVGNHVVGLLRFALMTDGRAEAGTLYACPLALVREEFPDLLPHAVTHVGRAETETALRVSDYLVDLAEGEYHVVVVHRPPDAKWARELVARLEGAGFRVTSLATAGGEQIDGALSERLSRSRAALVLCGEAYFAAPGWRAESAAILARALAAERFRVGLVRIDGSTVPESWQLAPRYDFSDREGPVGPEFDRLQFALAGREPPRPDSAPHRAFRVETEETGLLLEQVRQATVDGPHGVAALWEGWKASGRPLDAAALIVAEALLSQGRPQQALEVLAAAHEGVREQQLRAWALSDAGDVEASIRILERLREAGELEAETGGLLGGRYKRLWQSTGDRAYLEKSYGVYAATFERTLDPYPGINAAAMALRLGDAEASRRIAERVRDELAPVDHWTLATEAEVQLLVGNLEAARAGYASAVARIPHDGRNIATMRRQARDTLEAQGLPRDALDDAFRLSRPVVFSGHMVDAPGRPAPRFPPEKVEAARAAIRRRLDARDTVHGFCSAARGGDLLFLEELLARGGSAEVLLPFPLEDFLKTSVGEEWAERCERVLARKDRVELRVLAEQTPPESERAAAYARCNAALHDLAAQRAALLDEEPLLLVLWDGEEGDGAGGTSDAVRSWRERGGEVDRIDVASL